VFEDFGPCVDEKRLYVMLHGFKQLEADEPKATHLELWYEDNGDGFLMLRDAYKLARFRDGQPF
jgi:hypothetical protein